MEAYDVDVVLKNIFNDEDSNWKATDKVQLIIKELDHCKSDLKIFLEDSDIDLPSVLKESDELCSESNLLVEDLRKCKKEIEVETIGDIAKSIEIYDHLSKELKSIRYAEFLLENVIQCGELVKEFHLGQAAHSFTRSVESVSNLMQALDRQSGFDALDIASLAKEKAQEILETVIGHLDSEWNNYLSMSVKNVPRKTITSIYLRMNESQNCADIINALRICKRLDNKVNEFADNLMTNVLVPIIRLDSTVVYENDELRVTLINKYPSKAIYTTVISSHMEVLKVLRKKLSLQFDEDNTIFEMIGRRVSKEFCNRIMEECFVFTIPSTVELLHHYDEVTKDIEVYQDFLDKVKFFPPDYNLNMLSYMDDIESHFGEIATNALLETARTIMLKDLSVSMSIGVTRIDHPSVYQGVVSLDQEALNRLDKNIPKSLFYFPRCMISKSTQELLDHLYTMMEEAGASAPVLAKRWYYAARYVFELYDAVVPYHHEKYLQTIPQYVALFHNNCMYLAHNLLTLGDKWVATLGDMELDYPITFVDLVEKLRQTGYHYLTRHMQQQRKQILDNIRSSDLNCLVSKDVLDGNAETAVRQCLRQLHLLKNVWIGVFPANVFTRLMATLVNMLCEELIHRVCTVEDISAEMATQLSDMYSIVVVKAPLLFREQTDVEKHVKSWVKLQELIFVLRGTLKDIDSHWSDGRGPLAEHFKKDELRSLIKALFQNTQIRANLLSKIK